MRNRFRELVRRNRNTATASTPAVGSHIPANATGEEPPTAPVAAVSENSGRTSGHATEDLWTISYKALRARETDLVSDYERHIGARPEGLDEAAHLSAVLSPESIKGTVKALQDDRENKQWAVSIRGKDHKVRDQLESLVKLLTLADGVVKQALSAQPYAALAWSAVSVFLPLISATYTKDAAMVKGFAVIADLQMYWKLCEDTYLQSTTSQHEALVEPLSNLYSFILEYQIQAICNLSKKQLSRAWRKMAGADDWAAKEKQILEIHGRCIEFLGSLRANEIRENWTTQNRSLGHIAKVDEKILETIQDQDRRKTEKELLQALKSAGGNYLGGMDYNPNPVQGTCRWFFEAAEFSGWRDSSGSGVFWVTAGPGCGKSVLARTLVRDEHLKSTVAVATVETSPTSTVSAPITSSEAIICYFFFKDDVVARTKMTTALCALLHQLFVQAPEFLEQGVSVFSKNGAALTESFDDLWLLLLLCAENASGDVIYVLDALDECSGVDRKPFISQLDRLYADRPAAAKHLKFLITSRPYDTIEESFRPLQGRTQYFRFDADERHADISHDISLVIDANLDSFARDFDEPDRQRIADSLKSRGTKTYLWLYLTLDIIKQHPSRFRRVREVETLLSEIPTEVSDAYEKILNGSAQDSFSNAEQERIKSLILQIILAATRPLTLDEANYALTMALADENLTTHAELKEDIWKRDFESTVKNLCGLVISVYDGQLFFIHLTAREFLLREPEVGTAGVKWRGRFANADSLHEGILSSCMRYLLLSEFASRAIPLLEEDIWQYPLLEYASVNWTHHFRAQKHPDACSLSRARQLCNTLNNFLRLWGPIYLARTRELGESYHGHRFFDWTDLTVASFFGLDTIAEDILDTARVDIDAVGGEFGSPLQCAVAAQRSSTVALLLENKANVSATNARNYDTPLKLAALKVANREITELLLFHGASPLEPPNLLGNVALQGEPEIFYTLVAGIINIGSSDAVIKALEVGTMASSGFGCEALLANLLDDEIFGSPVLFTQERIRALMAVSHVGKRALASAFHYQGINTLLHSFFDQTSAPCLDISQGILEVVAEHYHPDIFKRFLDYCPVDTRKTGSLLIAAARNEHYAKSLPDFLLDIWDSPAFIDAETLSSLLGCYNILPAVSFFTRFPDDMAQYAECLICAVVSASHRRSDPDELPSNQQIISRILNLCDAEAVISDDLLLKTGLKGDTGTLELFLNYYSERSPPLQQLYEASTSNIFFGQASMEFLLERYGLTSVNTTKIMFAAASKRHGNGSLDVFLQKSPDQVSNITAEILASAASSDALDVLSKHLANQLPVMVPKALLIASDTGPHTVHFMMAHFLSYFEGTLMHPTEELVVNLLTGSYPWETMTILINKVGEKIEITERVLRAAVGGGLEMLEMLERWRPRSFLITQGMAEEAAVHENIQMLDYLAKRADDNLVINSDLYRLVDVYNKMHDIHEEADYGWQEVPDIPDLEDAQGRTTLHRALRGYVGFAYREWRGLLRFIIQFITVDINAKTKNSAAWTPLQYAVGGRDLQVVQILLDAGADATMANGRGETAISLIEKGFKTGMDCERLLAVLKGEERVAIEPVVTKYPRNSAPDGGNSH
ncbi:hypothetical protein NLG97_g1590 [Lecanicillium saksenae]|uniref:Uncharacterized protein n=1 Tax=Lecanicillium saksenae TaxID=468837 RepID=A0ACC1R5Z7_9HYPO|nr:hypothetical protein NLG97_g1590 [Lecanicillium saksenae]